MKISKIVKIGESRGLYVYRITIGETTRTVVFHSKRSVKVPFRVYAHHFILDNWFRNRSNDYNNVSNSNRLFISTWVTNLPLVSLSLLP